MAGRRQRTNECALFALCAAYAVDYAVMSRTYEQTHGRPWGEDGTQPHRDFVAKVFSPAAVSALTANRSDLAACLWNCRRYVISAFDGSTHVAFANEHNMVEDGIFPHAMPYAQYVRLLGDRGGRVLGETL